jgi:hypothetical protein
VEAVIGLDAFVLARVAEDETIARKAEDAPGDYRGHPAGTAPVWTVADATVFGHPVGARGSVEMTPGRMFAECRAKRRIVASLDMTPCPCRTADRCVIHDASAASPEFAVERYVDPITETMLRMLALPYADHPDYRPEEWKP